MVNETADDFKRELDMILKSILKNIRIKQKEALRVIAENKKRRHTCHVDAVMVHVYSDCHANNF